MAKTTKKVASTANTTTDGNISKARRVKLYLKDHPKARNKDIVEALKEFGVKVSDVSNAKSYMKMKKRRKTDPSRASIGANGPVKRGRKPAAFKEASVSLSEFQSAVNFAQSVGGFSRGRQLLEIVDQIKQL